MKLTGAAIHAVHQVGIGVAADERLLPLFWALNGHKQRQEDFPLNADDRVALIDLPGICLTASSDDPASSRSVADKVSREAENVAD